MQTGSINYAKEQQSVYSRFKDTLTQYSDTINDDIIINTYVIYVKTDKLRGILSVDCENKELDECELDQEFEKEYNQCVSDLKGK